MGTGTGVGVGSAGGVAVGRWWWSLVMCGEKDAMAV